MKLPHIYVLIIFVSTTTAATELLPRYTKPGCKEKCGNIAIPYPFGIGPNCFLNRWYAVDCKSSIPYLQALNNLPLLGINLNQQLVLVNVQMSSKCQPRIWNSSQILNLGSSPFLFSKSNNKFFFEGCGTVVILSGGNIITGCSATRCQPYLSFRKNICDDINCCQRYVPYYLKDYSMNVTSNQSCLSAFLEADNSHIDTLFPDQSFVGDSFSIPTVLQWTLSENDFSEASCGYNYSRINLQMDEHTIFVTGKCSCRNELDEGNPYVSGGCEGTEECRTCMETHGFCAYKESYGDSRSFICDYNVNHSGSKKLSPRAIFVGVAIVLFLMALGIVSYKVLQRAKDKKQKTIFFERNGGLLLKQQEARNNGLIEKTKIFTSEELEKATNYFNENTIIGRGGQGTVYKGSLNDGRTVAIKKSMVVDQSQLDQFINELVILSQLNHRNVVKLLGCCLETDVPILVSEFIPNGTLYEHIHHENTKVHISLNTRLQIATEVAGTLSYLHSAMSIPIYHRDIKSTNILLDEEYRAKISDFGTSRFVSVGVTHLTTLVRGTIGYLDPEYFQSSQFTEKSDVYSFGVVLVELLTRQKPICLSKFGETISLAAHFTTSFEEGRVMCVLDANMVKEGGRDVLLEVANLAIRCLNLCGKNRPTMKEVALKLEKIRMSYMSMAKSDFGKVKYNAREEEELQMLTYGESTSSNII